MILDQLRMRGSKQASELHSGREHAIAAALSDCGCERELNEDRWGIIESVAGTGYFVFDGMGGESGGEAAAQLSLDAVAGFLRDTELRDTAQAIEGAIQRAQNVISLRRQNPAVASMGTTVVGALWQGPEVVIAAVGDSRAYRIHSGGIDQLTSDHTFVQKLVDEGHIVPQDALLHPQSHILTRCVGSSIGFGIDIKRFWLSPAKTEEQVECLVLCSDGLYSLVTDDEIRSVVMSLPAEEACENLVRLAKERGGYDNITVMIIPLAGSLKTTPDESVLRSRNIASLTMGQPSCQKSQLSLQNSNGQFVSSFYRRIGIFLGVTTMVITGILFLIIKFVGS